MKYIVKLLPVEGEIFPYEPNKMIFYNGQARRMKNDGVLIKPNYHGCKTRFEYYKYVNAKPAKFFLCSREVSMEDMVYTTDEFWPNSKLIKADDLDLNALAKAYKVIGEISPEAVWVKEGMEFEDDEVSLRFVDIETGKSEREYKAGLKYLSKDKWKAIAFIKCPTCKYFH